MTFLEIIYIAPLVVTVASAISSVTPTKKDDRFVGKLQKVVDVLALNIGHAKRSK